MAWLLHHPALKYRTSLATPLATVVAIADWCALSIDFWSMLVVSVFSPAMFTQKNGQPWIDSACDVSVTGLLFDSPDSIQTPIPAPNHFINTPISGLSTAHYGFFFSHSFWSPFILSSASVRALINHNPLSTLSCKHSGRFCRVAAHTGLATARKPSLWQTFPSIVYREGQGTKTVKYHTNPVKITLRRRKLNGLHGPDVKMT